MPTPPLADLLRQHFPAATFAADDATLAVGSFAEWDSIAHYSFLLLVEEAYGVRFSVEEMSELKSLAAISAALANRPVA